MSHRRLDRSLVLAGCCALLSACGGTDEPQPPPPPSTPAAQSPLLKNEIPAEHLGAVLAAHLKGLGHMERLQEAEYERAVEQFRVVHRLAPGWVPGSINLAIALLNVTGARDAAAAGMGGARSGNPPGASQFDEALGLLEDVIKRDPENLHAHYSRGIILKHLGELAEAHREFRFVTERDPADAHAWWNRASTLPTPDPPDPEAIRTQAQEQIVLLTRALECNPYLVAALNQLQLAYGRTRQPEKQKELLELFLKLNPENNAAAPGELVKSYGEMGKYATVIDWSPTPKVAAELARPPRFDVPHRLDVRLAESRQWARTGDVPIATFDADGDGRLDLFLCGAAADADGSKSDLLLLNRGDGRFEDATAALGLPVAQASRGAAAGDFDADGRIDLFLAGPNRLYRNLGGSFIDVTETAGLPVMEPAAGTRSACWLDLDQDGDLDLYLVNEDRPNAAFRNDGVPVPIERKTRDNWAPAAVAPPELGVTAGLSLRFTSWPPEGAEALGAARAKHAGAAWLDVDGDRDLDLVVFADDAVPVGVLNDRLGRFHAVELKDLQARAAVHGLLAADFDRDGYTDLAIVPASGKVALWRNRPPRLGERPTAAFEFYPTDAHDWRLAVAADLDLDGATDLVGIGAGEPAPLWARNAGNGLKTVPLVLGPHSTADLAGLAVADLTGDSLPDLLLFRDGEGPYLARNLGNGHRWLALDLTGRWQGGFERARTNPHGLGAKVLAQGIDLKAISDHVTSTTGPTQSVGPIVLGLGGSPAAALLRLTWPDGVLQCELDVAADQRLAVVETNRKTGSCPVLFAFDGERFVCIGDFLGGGGLGYLVAPGVYAAPDRDEAVAIGPDQLRPVGGVLRLAIAEPMDEVAYLDQLVLEVVDHPAEVRIGLDERFAPGGNRPTGALRAWRTRIDPVRAADLAGRDLTATLRQTDRRTADAYRRLGLWVGYAEEHGIVLDFGDRLRDFGPSDRLILGLSGWVEYPYSQTNYAAATAGVPLKPPVLERQRDDGSWEILEPDPGYPAGLPRLTTLELTGKLAGPRCVLRLRTNMECSWDEAFVAVLEPEAAREVRTTALAVARASLGTKGYMRESSPDGNDPLLYDYARVDPAPLARLRGRLTRFGDVTPLLRQDDDQLCVLGPGDEVRLEFDAGSLTDLPAGWSRSYVLRAVGYCKDADPFTAASDTVEPLPWRGMVSYPCPRRPPDPAYDAYLEQYQTRRVGGD